MSDRFNEAGGHARCPFQAAYVPAPSQGHRPGQGAPQAQQFGDKVEPVGQPQTFRVTTIQP